MSESLTAYATLAPPRDASRAGLHVQSRIHTQLVELEASSLTRCLSYPYTTRSAGRCESRPREPAISRNSFRMAMTGTSCGLSCLAISCHSMRFLRVCCPMRARSAVLMLFINENMRSHSDVCGARPPDSLRRRLRISMRSWSAPSIVRVFAAPRSRRVQNCLSRLLIF